MLCDFDPTDLGPWPVDLVAVAVGEARFHRPGAHHALAIAGFDAALYPGSWSQWSADPTRPAATGPEPG